MREQLTEHIWRAENGVFWRVRDNTYETGMDIDRSIQQELADALWEERKRSARYRVALEHYADKTNWCTSVGDSDYGKDLWQGPDDDGFNVAQQALSEDREAAEE